MIAALPLVSSILSAVSPGDVAATARNAASAAVGAATAAGGTAAPGADFGQMLAQMASDTTQSLKTAENLSVDGLKGSANVQAVVQSVMTAQENLQTALAVRDKAVAAFQEVTRMSI